jgi:uncharacterized protein (DUF2236 family)
MVRPIEEILYWDGFKDRQYTSPRGDCGLFGPESVAWRVHADPSMLIGGLAGVMLSTLHPAAMAVVAERSRWQDDPFHRLSVTASYIRVTTFAAAGEAGAVIDHVRKVHAAKTVAAPGGGSYNASDPSLLRWVHVAEAWCFLRGYQRYGLRRAGADDEDRYFREVAAVAQRLGATNAPRNRAEVDEYFRAMKPTLRATPAARESIRALKEQRFPRRSVNLAYPLVFRAAVDLLPSWARRMIGLRRPIVAARPGTAALVRVLGFARGVPPSVREAQIRCR